MERTANSTEIADEVAGYLDYMNAIKDVSTGANGLTLKYVIDEAQAPVKEIADGLAYYVFDGGPPTAFRKPLLDANRMHPKPARYIVVRTHSQNPDNEKAPYLQAFWVTVPHGSELAATVDENYERRVEPLTRGAYTGLDHKTVNERFNNTIIDAFAPRSKYERSFWLPTKKFTTPSVVMFAYHKEETKPEGWKEGKDRVPMIWFAKDFKTSALVGAAYTLTASLSPNFQSGEVRPVKEFHTKQKAFETWRKNIEPAAKAYFDGETIDTEIARDIFTSLSALIPPEYQKWVIEYFDDFWKFLSSHFKNKQPQETPTEQEASALQSWGNVGSPGDAPAEPFTPNDEQRSKYRAIKQPGTITVDWQFGLDAYKKFQYGHHAREMEDKWNIYFEDNVVHFHRSWTGNEIFRLSLIPMREMHVGPNQVLQDYKHYMVSSFEVEQDAELYKETDEQKIKDMLLQVLRVVLKIEPILVAEAHE